MCFSQPKQPSLPDPPPLQKPNPPQAPPKPPAPAPEPLTAVTEQAPVKLGAETKKPGAAISNGTASLKIPLGTPSNGGGLNVG